MTLVAHSDESAIEDEFMMVDCSLLVQLMVGDATDILNTQLRTRPLHVHVDFAEFRPGSTAPKWRCCSQLTRA